MSFGENLQFLRRQRNMTQEGLAEQLEVSRQSVSKWESDTAYSEMDTILKLCDLFGCNMDTLLRGDVSLLFGTDTAGYDKHMNAFARAMAAGVGLVLLGVTLLCVLVGLGDDGSVGVLILLALLVAAVAIFIISGMGHSRFARQHPVIEPFYTPEQADRFERRFPALIAGPVALILIGVICTVALGLQPAPAGLTGDQWGGWAAAALLLCVTVAASTLVWAGIQKAKYDIASYNRENVPTPENRRTRTLWGSAMVGATAIYVGTGLAFDLWDRAWVVYPIVALLCVAVTIFLNRNSQ